MSIRRFGVFGTIALLLLISCAKQQGQEEEQILPDARCATRDSTGQCVLWNPSLMELITRPELFAGKPVVVIGFVNFEFEGNALYVSRTDWENGINRNGLWIEPPADSVVRAAGRTEPPNRRYVIVKGTFNPRMSGHFGMWSGSIDHVTRIDPWGRAGRPTGFQTIEP